MHYRYENGAVALVPEEAETVRRIFEARAAGMAYEKIAGKLSMDGIPTQLGGTWRVSTLRRIVANRFYTGIVVIGRFVRRDLTRLSLGTRV